MVLKSTTFYLDFGIAGTACSTIDAAGVASTGRFNSRSRARKSGICKYLRYRTLQLAGRRTGLPNDSDAGPTDSGSYRGLIFGDGKHHRRNTKKQRLLHCIQTTVGDSQVRPGENFQMRDVRSIGEPGRF